MSDTTRDRSVSSIYLYRAISDHMIAELALLGADVRKGEQTRQEIIRKAAPIFNQKGYEGATVSDLMRATGLEKGGIYRHFGSKQELAGDAFDYAWKIEMDRLLEAKSRFRIQFTASNKSCGTFGTGAPGWCREAARC